MINSFITETDSSVESDAKPDDDDFGDKTHISSTKLKTCLCYFFSSLKFEENYQLCQIHLLQQWFQQHNSHTAE